MYRAGNVEKIEEGKKMSYGRVQARGILEKEGKEIDQFVVEQMAKKYMRNLKGGK